MRMIDADKCVFNGEFVSKELLWKISETHSINLKAHFRYEEEAEAKLEEMKEGVK